MKMRDDDDTSVGAIVDRIAEYMEPWLFDPYSLMPSLNPEGALATAQRVGYDRVLLMGENLSSSAKHGTTLGYTPVRYDNARLGIEVANYGNVNEVLFFASGPVPTRYLDNYNIYSADDFSISDPLHWIIPHLDATLAAGQRQKDAIAVLAEASTALMLASDTFVTFPMDHIESKPVNILFRSNVLNYTDDEEDTFGMAQLMAFVQPTVHLEDSDRTIPFTGRNDSLPVNVGTYHIAHPPSRTELATDLLISLSAIIDMEMGVSWACRQCDLGIHTYDVVSLDRLLLLAGHPCSLCYKEGPATRRREQNFYNQL